MVMKDRTKWGYWPRRLKRVRDKKGIARTGTNLDGLAVGIKEVETGGS